MSHLAYPFAFPLGGPPPVGSGGPLTAPFVGRSRGAVQITIPTATNTCLLVVENITANLRLRQSSNLQLPSLYKRAYLIAYETDEVAVVKP